MFFSLLLLLTGCNEKTVDPRTYYDVTFDTNTEVLTNQVPPQKVRLGMHAKKPSVYATEEKYQNYIVYGWYKDKALSEEWTFTKDKVTSSLTLYAKWGYQYQVDYYLGENPNPVYSTFLKEGEKAEERVSDAVGFEYLGSYQDQDYTKPFDFSLPIEKDTKIYIKKSDSISLSETSKTGALSELLTPMPAGSDPQHEIFAKEGYCEPITLEDGGTYTYINFGYSPYNPDPYVELALPLDITHSQKLTFTYKNLGEGEFFSLYFVTYLDPKEEIYSATGNDYSGDFCDMKKLTAEEKNMDKDSDWKTITFDLTDPSSGNPFGYSVWGTSPYLAKLRIQSTYRSKNENDLSNAFILKSIEGSYKEVKTEDSPSITALKTNEDASKLEEVSSKQEEIDGFIFPKDRSEASIEGGTLYQKSDCLLITTENEVALRGTDYSGTKVTLKPNEEKKISLDTLKTLNLRLKNYGYRDEITLRVINTLNNVTEIPLSIGVRNEAFYEAKVSLANRSTAVGTLERVEILYFSDGVDNALALSSLSFTSYEAESIPGLNFNDWNTCGFTTSSAADISYNASRGATRFQVKSSEDILSSKNFSLTDVGYASMTLTYYIPEDNSTLSKLHLYFLRDGNWIDHIFELEGNKSVRRKTSSLNLAEKGKIEGVKLSFEGTGSIDVLSVSFDLNPNTSVNFALDSTRYIYADWAGNCTFTYDQQSHSSVIRPSLGKESNFRYYIGIAHSDFSTPYPNENISLTNAKKVTLIYQNPSSISSLGITLGFDRLPKGSGEGNNYEGSMTIKTDMKDDAFDAVSLDIPKEYLEDSYLLARFVIHFSGSSLKLRAFIVE